MKRFRSGETALIMVLLGSVAVPMAAMAQPRAADEIGVTTATNPATRGTPPRQPTRVLQIGTNVLSRERVQSTDQGSAQFLFVDRSSLTVGPGSDLVLDEFVYNPADGTGRIAATLTRGVMRFVGGQISHQGNVTINTPTATIGVRGGVVLLSIDQAGNTDVRVNFGQAHVVSRVSGETQRVMRPNFGVSISSSGVVSPPARFTAEELVQITSLLHSAPGQTGGAIERPTDERAANAGVGRANANVVARSRSGLADVDTRSIINGQLQFITAVVVAAPAPVASSSPVAAPPAASPPAPPPPGPPPPEQEHKPPHHHWHGWSHWRPSSPHHRGASETSNLRVTPSGSAGPSSRPAVQTMPVETVRPMGGVNFSTVMPTTIPAPRDLAGPIGSIAGTGAAGSIARSAGLRSNGSIGGRLTGPTGGSPFGPGGSRQRRP
jgi:FecR protein